MPRFPLRDDTPIRATPHGRYGAERRDASEGSCGVSPYPCRHPGVDLAAPQGTAVVAPEPGLVVEVATGDAKPWTGYGPGLVVLKGRSGGYHLLAHLEPEVVPRWQKDAGILDDRPTLYPLARPVAEGELLGYVSSANHVHWEKRSDRTSGRLDPVAWWVANNPGVPLEDRKRIYAQLSALQLSDAGAAGGGDAGVALVVLGLLLWSERGRW